MKIAYFDCFAGAGGDMIVAAMLDAGLDGEFLKSQLASLGLNRLEINISETHRGHLRAVRFEPQVQQNEPGRNLAQITELIKASKISQTAKDRATEVFKRLADAEARAHGTKPEEIHFHETGALDSIADIVSACIGLDALGIEKVYCSPLPVGGGIIECSHGLLPSPAPATVELLKDVPVMGGPVAAELVTPTAAAVLVTIVDEFGPLPAMKIEKTGYGAGSKEFEKVTNLLRLIIGSSDEGDSAEADSVCLLEANTDDATGEAIGFVTEKLLRNGALDVFTTPIYMKHNRPAVQISVICEIGDAETLGRLLLEEGMSLGLRKQTAQRMKLARETITVKTEYGDIRIKAGYSNGKLVTAKPEYSDCASAADNNKVSFKAVSEAAMRAFWAQAGK
jgi:uncharacterized protein (TIGR00299 family) protein